MLRCCEIYADDYHVNFNASKYQVLMCECEATRRCVMNRPAVMMNNVVIPYVDSTVHLGSMIGRNAADEDVKRAARDLTVRARTLHSHYGHCTYSVIRKLFLAYCTSFYGSMLWRLDRLGPLEVAWRKCLRMLFRVPTRTHSVYIPLIVRRPPLNEELLDRFARFWTRCLASQNQLVRLACELAVASNVSVVGMNVAMLSNPPVSNIEDEIQSRCETIVELLKCRSKELDTILDDLEIDIMISHLCLN